jgi:tRNA nucleotidyltransferase/poly(A) polymerase
MLRVIRFASRFQFKLDNDIIDNINKEYFIKLFNEILSNERIEKELSLMMESFYAYSSIYMLFKFKLLESCLKFDEGKKEDYIKCVNMMILGNCLKEKF